MQYLSKNNSNTTNNYNQEVSKLCTQIFLTEPQSNNDSYEVERTVESLIKSGYAKLAKNPEPILERIWDYTEDEDEEEYEDEDDDEEDWDNSYDPYWRCLDPIDEECYTSYANMMKSPNTKIDRKMEFFDMMKSKLRSGAVTKEKAKEIVTGFLSGMKEHSNDPDIFRDIEKISLSKVIFNKQLDQVITKSNNIRGDVYKEFSRFVRKTESVQDRWRQSIGHTQQDLAKKQKEVNNYFQSIKYDRAKRYEARNRLNNELEKVTNSSNRYLRYIHQIDKSRGKLGTKSETSRYLDSLERSFDPVDKTVFKCLNGYKSYIQSYYNIPDDNFEENFDEDEDALMTDYEASDKDEIEINTAFTSDFDLEKQHIFSRRQPQTWLDCEKYRDDLMKLLLKYNRYIPENKINECFNEIEDSSGEIGPTLKRYIMKRKNSKNIFDKLEAECYEKYSAQLKNSSYYSQRKSWYSSSSMKDKEPEGSIAMNYEKLRKLANESVTKLNQFTYRYEGKEMAKRVLNRLNEQLNESGTPAFQRMKRIIEEISTQKDQLREDSETEKFFRQRRESSVHETVTRRLLKVYKNTLKKSKNLDQKKNKILGSNKMKSLEHATNLNIELLRLTNTDEDTNNAEKKITRACQTMKVEDIERVNDYLAKIKITKGMMNDGIRSYTNRMKISKSFKKRFVGNCLENYSSIFKRDETLYEADDEVCHYTVDQMEQQNYDEIGRLRARMIASKSIASFKRNIFRNRENYTTYLDSIDSDDRNKRENVKKKIFQMISSKNSNERCVGKILHRYYYLGEIQKDENLITSKRSSRIFFYQQKMIREKFDQLSSMEKKKHLCLHARKWIDEVLDETCSEEGGSRAFKRYLDEIEKRRITTKSETCHYITRLSTQFDRLSEKDKMILTCLKGYSKLCLSMVTESDERENDDEDIRLDQETSETELNNEKNTLFQEIDRIEDPMERANASRRRVLEILMSKHGCLPKTKIEENLSFIENSCGQIDDTHLDNYIKTRRESKEILDKFEAECLMKYKEKILDCCKKYEIKEFHKSENIFKSMKIIHMKNDKINRIIDNTKLELDRLKFTQNGCDISKELILKRVKSLFYPDSDIPKKMEVCMKEIEGKNLKETSETSKILKHYSIASNIKYPHEKFIVDSLRSYITVSRAGISKYNDPEVHREIKLATVSAETQTKLIMMNTRDIESANKAESIIKEGMQQIDKSRISEMTSHLLRIRMARGKLDSVFERKISNMEFSDSPVERFEGNCYRNYKNIITKQDYPYQPYSRMIKWHRETIRSMSHDEIGLAKAHAIVKQYQSELSLQDQFKVNELISSIENDTSSEADRENTTVKILKLCSSQNTQEQIMGHALKEYCNLKIACKYNQSSRRIQLSKSETYRVTRTFNQKVDRILNDPSLSAEQQAVNYRRTLWTTLEKSHQSRTTRRVIRRYLTEIHQAKGEVMTNSRTVKFLYSLKSDKSDPTNILIANALEKYSSLIKDKHSLIEEKNILEKEGDFEVDETDDADDDVNEKETEKLTNILDNSKKTTLHDIYESRMIVKRYLRKSNFLNCEIESNLDSIDHNCPDNIEKNKASFIEEKDRKVIEMYSKIVGKFHKENNIPSYKTITLIGCKHLKYNEMHNVTLNVERKFDQLSKTKTQSREAKNEIQRTLSKIFEKDSDGEKLMLRYVMEIEKNKGQILENSEIDKFITTSKFSPHQRDPHKKLCISCLEGYSRVLINKHRNVVSPTDNMEIKFTRVTTSTEAKLINLENNQHDKSQAQKIILEAFRNVGFTQTDDVERNLKMMTLTNGKPGKDFERKLIALKLSKCPREKLEGVCYENYSNLLLRENGGNTTEKKYRIVRVTRKHLSKLKPVSKVDREKGREIVHQMILSSCPNVTNTDVENKLNELEEASESFEEEQLKDLHRDIQSKCYSSEHDERVFGNILNQYRQFLHRKHNFSTSLEQPKDSAYDSDIDNPIQAEAVFEELKGLRTQTSSNSKQKVVYIIRKYLPKHEKGLERHLREIECKRGKLVGNSETSKFLQRLENSPQNENEIVIREILKDYIILMKASTEDDNENENKTHDGKMNEIEYKSVIKKRDSLFDRLDDNEANLAGVETARRSILIFVRENFSNIDENEVDLMLDKVDMDFDGDLGKYIDDDKIDPKDYHGNIKNTMIKKYIEIVKRSKEETPEVNYFAFTPCVCCFMKLSRKATDFPTNI